MEFDSKNWRTEKIIGFDELEGKAQELRGQGKKLVTVNGSFDLLHFGHLDQLEEAAQVGDVLFVGINSDQSVKGYKGEERPFIPEEGRAAMLAALACVDYVVIIDDEASEVQNLLIRAVRPDVHVNGPEYGEPEEWIEWPAMQEVGAEGYVVKMRNSVSTSELVSKIRGV